MKREPRYYEISRKQIFLSIFIASIALTAVFNIGIYVGKRRVISAERKEEQQKLNSILSEIEAINYPINPDHAEKQIEEEQEIKDSSANKQKNISGGQKEIYVKEKIKEANEKKVSKEESILEKKKYTVKVGTFAQRKNAENLLNQIKNFGYESWIIDDPNSQSFHVIVGKFNDKNSAESFGKELKTKHPFISGYIIRELKDE